VAILPYLEQKVLYDKFRLDEPWDSPNNLELLKEIPRQFASPSDPTVGMTHYRVFVGPGAMFEQNKRVRIRDITDGLSGTVMVVETAEAVPWTKPEEIDYKPNGPFPTLGLPGFDVVLVVLADGSVQRVSKKCSQVEWHKAIQINDGQIPGPELRKLSRQRGRE
jgi:hypothetical protein